MPNTFQTSLDVEFVVPTVRRLPTWYKDRPSGAFTSQGTPTVKGDPQHRTPMVASKDVLVVEDEIYLCELIADVLESEGHTTRRASNGLEALNLMRERKPQIVLLDLMMPIMDGWEFMDALRKNPQWDGVPIVIITAIYDAKRTQDETGARAVITKPFDIDQITESVRLYAT